MRATKKITNPEIRSFKETDFYGFAGAEEFADGSQPLICDHTFADGSGFLMVISKELTSVLFSDAQGNPDRQSEFGGYLLDNNFKNAEYATFWFNLVRPMLTSKDAILALGFEA